MCLSLLGSLLQEHCLGHWVEMTETGGHWPGAGSRRAVRPPETNVDHDCTATPYCGSMAETTRLSPR